DFAKLRNAQDQRDNSLFINEDTYSAEIAQNPILQPFYEKITNEGFRYSNNKERVDDLKKLVSSLTLIDPKIKSEDVTIPLQSELRGKIQALTQYEGDLRYKQ